MTLGALDEALIQRTRRPHATSFDDPLSLREQEVLQLVAAGLKNAEIAERLFLSTETVKTHVRHIFDKLGARNRPHAVALAAEDRKPT
jgi:DNA-binding NarL/FixJ family response regulator